VRAFRALRGLIRGNTIRTLNKIVHKIEGAPLAGAPVVLAIISIYVIRIFFEGFSRAPLSAALVPTELYVAEIALYFIFILSSTLLVLRGLTKKPFAILVKIIGAGTLAFLLVPIVDLIAYQGHPLGITFIELSNWQQVWSAFFTMARDVPGSTLGLLVEVVTSLIAITIYVYITTRSAIKAIVGLILTYSIMFLAAVAPSFISLLLYGGRVTSFNLSELAIAFTALLTFMVLFQRQFIKKILSILVYVVPILTGAFLFWSAGLLFMDALLWLNVSSLALSVGLAIAFRSDKKKVWPIMLVILAITNAYLYSHWAALIAAVLLIPIAFSAPTKAQRFVLAGLSPLILILHPGITVIQLKIAVPSLIITVLIFAAVYFLQSLVLRASNGVQRAPENTGL